MKVRLFSSWIVVVFLGVVNAQDGAKQETAAGVKPIRIQGSDTMLQLNLSFADALKKGNPPRELLIRGEGSSTGFRALITGEADVAASSRPIKEAERARLKEKRGLDAKEIIVAFNPIAVYVHADNPIDSVTVAELTGIYTTKGMTNRWEDVGATLGGKARAAGGIHRFGRSASSGTYGAFLKMITAASPAKFRDGITRAAGSKALVEAVSNDPLAIGYSPTASRIDGVKFLKVNPDRDGQKPVAPSPENVRTGKYPLSGKLYFYTAGEAEGQLKTFIDWLATAEAQGQIEAAGFVAP